MCLVAACFEAQGGTRSSTRRPTSITSSCDQVSNAVAGQVGRLQRRPTEKIHRDDFKRLWGTNFLDNLWIDVSDYVFTNGVVGKIVIYHMEERQRVKIVDYVGSKKVEMSKIDEKLKDEERRRSASTPSSIRAWSGKVAGVVRDMLRGEGLPVRRGHAGDQGDRPAVRSWST